MVRMDLMMSGLRRQETLRSLKTEELKSQRSLPLKLLPIINLNMIFQGDNIPKEVYNLRKCMKKNLQKLNDNVHYITPAQ